MRQLLVSLVCALVIAGVAVPAAWPDDRTVGEKVDDARITATVKAKLTTAQVKNLVKVDVDTHDGIVRLQGIVPTSADRLEAERLARGTKGVRGVTNELRVEGTEPSPSASPRR